MSLIMPRATQTLAAYGCTSMTFLLSEFPLSTATSNTGDAYKEGRQGACLLPGCICSPSRMLIGEVAFRAHDTVRRGGGVREVLACGPCGTVSFAIGWGLSRYYWAQPRNQCSIVCIGAPRQKTSATMRCLADLFVSRA